MSTVVQTTYRPQMAYGLEGMIAEMTGSEVSTRLCETAAGIGFGKAVGFGTGTKGCVLGGAAFFGLSVRDITLSLVDVDPLSTNTYTLDKYGLRTNVAVMSRGHMWVKPQGIVTPGAAVYYDQTSGQLGPSASGLGASGWIKFANNPADGQTMVINTVTITFKATGATGDQVPIGATLGDTVYNAVNVLNGSATALLATQTYTVDPPTPAGGGNAGDTIIISMDAVGTAGNAIAIGALPPGATKSGAQLSGGSAAATLIASAYWVTGAVATNLAIVSLGIQK